MELLMRCVQCFTKENNNCAADAVCAERNVLRANEHCLPLTIERKDQAKLENGFYAAIELNSFHHFSLSMSEWVERRRKSPAVVNFVHSFVWMLCAVPMPNDNSEFLSRLPYIGIHRYTWSLPSIRISNGVDLHSCAHCIGHLANQTELRSSRLQFYEN